MGDTVASIIEGWVSAPRPAAVRRGHVVLPRLKLFDPTELCAEEGKSVWVLYAGACRYNNQSGAEVLGECQTSLSSTTTEICRTPQYLQSALR
jgi:hypothetical protein